MTSYLQILNEAETSLMLKAPILVTILIAGADCEVDHKEIKKAISLVEKNAKVKSILSEYFSEVSQDFEDKFMVVFQSYPLNCKLRNEVIVGELSQLNAILPRLDRTFATLFYDALRKTAQSIAESSGGVLGINSVGDEEARYINLYMINAPGSQAQ